MPDDFLVDLDIPVMDAGQVNLPSASPTPSANEDAIIGGDEVNPRAPFSMDDEATTYFNQVTEGEALNYIMFLHDTHAISFDRLTELKELLTSTPSFLPKGN